MCFFFFPLHAFASTAPPEWGWPLDSMHSSIRALLYFIASHAFSSPYSQPLIVWAPRGQGCVSLTTVSDHLAQCLAHSRYLIINWMFLIPPPNFFLPTMKEVKPFWPVISFLFRQVGGTFVSITLLVSLYWLLVLNTWSRSGKSGKSNRFSFLGLQNYWGQWV